MEKNERKIKEESKCEKHIFLPWKKTGANRKMMIQRLGSF